MANLEAQLRGATKDELARIIDELEPTADRPTMALVAEYGFLTDDEGPWKEAATRFFIRSAPNYFPNLSPTFHVVPWASDQLLDTPDFLSIYDATHEATAGFSSVSASEIRTALDNEPRSLVIFRMIAALTRNQVSYVLNTLFNIKLSGDELRILEREGSNARSAILRKWLAATGKVGDLLHQGVAGTLMPFREGIDPGKFKSLTEKVDTIRGWESVAEVATRGVSYGELLYQRYVGGTFGQAINASTAVKADLLEDPVENLLVQNRIPYYRVGARERIEGWEQAPDFLIPNTHDPSIVIEAKVAEDGGTARDKAARIERLARLAHNRRVIAIAVIDGLGFFRINDVLAPILANTQGRVYSAANLADLLDLPEMGRWKGQATAS